MPLRCVNAARRFGAPAVMLVTALAAVFLTAGPAQAHTTLKESSPAKDATVASPAEIVLTFNDEVMLPQVVVTGAGGSRHQSGKAEASGVKVTQAIGGTLEPGVYTVGWRVVASDGHPVTGTYEFTVEGTSETPEASAPTTTAATPEPAPVASGTPAAADGDDGGSAGWLWVGLAALVVALVAGGIGLVRRRSTAGG